MPHPFRNVATVFTGTLSSRLLGLLRTILMASHLGLSAASGAFIFAFTLPNLFRRFLGEGELNSAAIPLLSEKLQREGKEAVFTFANSILTRVFLLSLLATVVLIFLNFGGLAYLNTHLPQLQSDKLYQWRLGLYMGIAMAYYVPLVCLTASLISVINLLGHYRLSSSMPVLTNLVMIATLLALGNIAHFKPEGIAWGLCVAVLLSGLLQLALCTLALKRHGWRPQWNLTTSPEIKAFKQLFSIGLIAAAITFLSTLTTRIIAFSLDIVSISAINYAERLIQLPIGLFTVSAITVFFPQMSHHAATNNPDNFTESFQQARSFILLFTLPSAAGLIALAEPLLIFLFQWGQFNAQAVRFTIPLLTVYALSIPLYSISILGFRSLQSLKQHRIVAIILLKGFLIHLALSLLLIRSLGATGLALGNLGANLLQVYLVSKALKTHTPLKASPQTLLLKMMGATLMMGISAACVWHILLKVHVEHLKTASMLACMTIPFFALLYIVILRALCPQQRKFIDTQLKKLLQRLKLAP